MRRWIGRKYRMNVACSILFLAVSAALLVYAMLRIQPIAWYIVRFLASRSNNIMLWMNLIPVFLLLLLFYFVTNQPIASVSLVGLLLVALSIVNRYKIILRGDPLLHWDLTLFSEAIETMRGLQAHTIQIGLIATLALVGVTWLCCMKWHAVAIEWKARLYCIALTLSVLLLAYDGLYGNKALYTSLPVYGDFYNLTDVFNSRGFLYSFLYTLNTQGNNNVLPKDEKAVALAAADMPKKDIKSFQNEYKPNIIMIMGESFSDLSQSDVFDFSGYTDPLETFSRMSEEGITGRLVVPSRGGGTADTEFDVLTANASRYLRNASYAYRLLVRPTEALPSILREIGYRSFALHPGYQWFYNRQNVYPNIGFSEAVFENDFPADAYLDLYISEKATYDKLIEMLTAYLAEPEPVFAFCLTIQNHAGYEDRFLPPGTVNFQANIPLSAKEENILSNYFKGITDADEQLKRLMEFLNEREEPFVLVYFGDHLPSLPQELYSRVLPGTDAQNAMEKDTILYSSPFLIWQNDAAKAYEPLDNAKNDTGLLMSSNYFGAYLLDTLGFQGISAYFDYANELRQSLPVLMEQQCFTTDGESVTDLPPTLLDKLTLYKAWMRHQVYE